ncbi:MAG: diguanylate cyclase [Clostridiales bacterium]|nr:diguanylate cyclase [Clostridiales bacterium]
MKRWTAAIALCLMIACLRGAPAEADLAIAEPRQNRLTIGALAAGGLTVAALALLLGFCMKSRAKLKVVRAKFETFSALQDAFLDASEHMVYLKDENLNYAFVNRAVERFYNRSASDILGRGDFELSTEEFAVMRRKTDLAAKQSGASVRDEIVWNGQSLSSVKFPVRLPDGKTGIGAIIRDVTLERAEEKRREQMHRRHKILADALSRGFASTREQLDFVLNEALELTDSVYGYIYLYDDQEQLFTLNSWTRSVVRDCAVKDLKGAYKLESSGFWGEVVRTKQPVILNDFEAPHPLKKGFPEGHVPIKRFVSVPVLSDGRIVAVVGMANKAEEYDELDVYELSLLMNGVWNAVKRREVEERIEYLGFHDALTGLYNRRFFNEELLRLDTARNLPLSIVMGDVNGLKLTNDIFGHAAGDMLLERIAQVFRRVCRADDIIARWGGDEFVLLFPRTAAEDAGEIVKRIKAEFSKERIKSVRGSISMGVASKDGPRIDIAQVLGMAEEAMYMNKALEEGEANFNVGEIIEALHADNPREQAHSENVSELCQALGRELNLPPEELRRLKDAGYLHDIGKIALDHALLSCGPDATERELNEVRRHPIVGYRILTAFDDTVDLAPAVLAHQERWDGFGYPKGLKGEEIPLPARIIAVSETYERRVFDGGNPSEAVDFIRKGAGGRFDPRVAEAFANMMERKK